jgi:hypothetical protein
MPKPKVILPAEDVRLISDDFKTALASRDQWKATAERLQAQLDRWLDSRLTPMERAMRVVYAKGDDGRRIANPEVFPGRSFGEVDHHSLLHLIEREIRLALEHAEERAKK